MSYPHSVASTPEAQLCAAVIGQALEDAKLKLRLRGVKLRSIHYQRRCLNAARDGERFIFRDLKQWIESIGATDIFHAESIQRKARTILDEQSDH